MPTLHLPQWLSQFPSRRDWLFSIKTFSAAMLALYVAMLLALPRPYWSMATVYVVSHPLLGATRSKGLYRVGGTLLGACAAVLLTPLLDQAPLLFMLAIAVWTGSLLYLALLDRTPRNYTYMLAAYSLPLMALPAVSAPDQIFDLAVARSEEIMLGIVCASLVGAIVFPGKVAPLLSARVDAWLRDAAAWAADVLESEVPHRAHGSRHQLAADILVLDQIMSQLAYDTNSAASVGQARHLRERLSMMLPILSSVTASVAQLRAQPGGVPPALQALMQEIAAWMRTRSADGDRGEHLAQALDQVAPASGAADWSVLLADHLRTGLHDLVLLWQDCLALRAGIAESRDGPRGTLRYQRRDLSRQARHYDHGMMVFSCASASLFTFAIGLLWIWSGWDDGGSAVIMGAIASCFFAAQDEPARSQWTFFVWNTVCMVLGTVLLFRILPATQDFEVLMLALLPPFLLAGSLATRPQFTIMAMTLTVSTASSMGLSGAYNANFPAFINSQLASITGILLALLWTLVTRPFGVRLALRRLVHAWWADLARMSAGEHGGDHAELAARMRDRLTLLMPRVAASGHDRLADGFSELRVGLAVLDLQRAEPQLDAGSQSAVHRVLQGVAAHYEGRLSGHRAPAAVLDARVDEALAAVARDEGAMRHDTLRALTEIRLTLAAAGGTL
ncbi:MAG TPA: FUSC family protein [Aquabacterium sp.]|nr:FUSC family protein [Aquabacterium sp.]